MQQQQQQQQQGESTAFRQKKIGAEKRLLRPTAKASFCVGLSLISGPSGVDIFRGFARNRRFALGVEELSE